MLGFWLLLRLLTWWCFACRDEERVGGLGSRLSVLLLISSLARAMGWAKWIGGLIDALALLSFLAGRKSLCCVLTEVESL